MIHPIWIADMDGDPYNLQQAQRVIVFPHTIEDPLQVVKVDFGVEDFYTIYKGTEEECKAVRDGIVKFIEKRTGFKLPSVTELVAKNEKSE